MSDPNDNANRARETEEAAAAPETKPEVDQASEEKDETSSAEESSE
jgi:hypothetical protein